MKNKFEQYKNNRIIRLVYTATEKYFGNKGLNVGETLGVSSPFLLPQGVTFEEACKVVSYLSDKVEREENLQPCSNNSVARVSNILQNYGFTKLNAEDFGYKVTNLHAHGEYIPFYTLKRLGVPEVKGIVDIITVGANDNCFNKTKMNKRYFDWYAPNVSNSQFNEITNKIGKTIDR